MVVSNAQEFRDRSGRRHLDEPKSDAEPSQPARQLFVVYRSRPVPFASDPPLLSFSALRLPNAAAFTALSPGLSIVPHQLYRHVRPPIHSQWIALDYSAAN